MNKWRGLMEEVGWKALDVGQGIALVILSVAPTGLNVAAFATGVVAIDSYCGGVF